MDEALVSIIVPVYNSETFLERTLKSILEQTYENIEIILIDDGSYDRSREICDCYAIKDTRIKVFHITNHGVSYARNYGLDNAHGTYVHFVDSDDLLPKDFVQKMLENIISQKSDVVFCGLSRVFEYSENLNRLENRTYTVDRYFSALYKGERFCTTSSCIGMYRMSIIRNHHVRFPEEFQCGEDALFVIEYMKHVKRISSVKDIVYYYMFDNENSCTKSIFYDHFKQEQRRYNELCKIITDINVMKEISFCYIDRIIRELIIYVKYSPEDDRKIKRDLKNFINDNNTKYAILNYHRNSPAKSFWIPVAIKYRMTEFLYILLKRRRLRINGQQTIKSVYCNRVIHYYMGDT